MSASTFDFADQCGPQLVPSSAFNQNLRAILTKKQWSDFRQAVFSKHGTKCAYCNAKPKQLDCHEIWQYKTPDDGRTGIQSLVKVLPLCKRCHQVCHIGFWSLKGKKVYNDIMAHMVKVRKISWVAAEAEVNTAFSIHTQLSCFDWTLDVSAASDYITKKGESDGNL